MVVEDTAFSVGLLRVLGRAVIQHSHVGPCLPGCIWIGFLQNTQIVLLALSLFPAQKDSVAAFWDVTAFWTP